MNSNNSNKRSGKAAKRQRNRGASAPAKEGARSEPARAASANAYPFVFGKQEPAPTEPVPPMFHRVDWLTFAVTTLVVMIGYYWTLAPDLTLEVSGELAVGSMYAGIPHPPGYPVWTIYTWLFTKLVPFSNIAWRVALSSAFAGALSCGIIGMMVSRGTRSMFELFESFKGIPEETTRLISIVCGYVAGMLMGFNGFMWSQAVIVEVYTLSVLTLVLQMVCLMRWMHAPHQHRWLYLAWFWAGICFTNHQTLLVAVVGMEIAILARDRGLGRDRFVMNALFFFLGLIALNLKGGASSYSSLIFKAFLCIGAMCVVLAVVMTVISNALMTRVVPAVVSYLAWGGGVLFYLYMPLAGMSNPPMQWGYPRIREGFIHALTRGQYEKANPTSGLDRFVEQIATYVGGAIEEFNLVYLALVLVPVIAIYYRRLTEVQKLWLMIVSGLYAFVSLIVLVKGDGVGAWMSLGAGLACGYVFLLLALIPFLFYEQNRQHPLRAWLGGVGAIYLFLSLLLLFLLNPQPDRQSQQLNRVFFTASYVPVSMFIGHGLALIAGVLVASYRNWRPIVMIGAAVATMVAVFALVVMEDFYWIAHFTAYVGIGLALAFFFVLAVRPSEAPVKPLLALIALFPIYTFASHWAENEQRGHLFGYWFGHDMFTPPFEGKDGKPLYPEMAKDAVLYGGTDPGRFCPTYMIFCESFIPPQKRLDPDFDRRDVYIITQNALADATYLMYIRAHYNRSTQIDPPFFQECLRSQSERELGVKTNALARLVRPLDSVFTGIGDWIEKDRRAGSSFFEEEDFKDVTSVAKKIKAGKDGFARYLYEKLDEDVREDLDGDASEGRLKDSLADGFNELLEAGPLFEPQRFEGIELSQRTRRFIAQNPQSHTLIRLNRLLLEEYFGDAIAKSLGGVYPDLEINISSPETSQRCFEQYVQDAQRRLEHDMTKPNEPKQIKPGEQVNYDPASGRVSVSGQVAVMAINGLLTKDMFDRNPDHEFYVEESFPLDWMYPHLTPYGIIMKIEREPIAEMTQAMVDRDHEFWSQYSSRLIGNWITYDTPVKEICDFVERVFLHRDFKNFEGDPKFIRDDNAKKAFSKLRSAIAGLYFWRINHAGGKGNLAEQQRMIKEADFAFRQAFAYCPFSPEAVFRYSNLLISLRRIEDAEMIARTFLKFDKNNGAVQGLLAQLQGLKAQQAAGAPPQPAPQPTPAGDPSGQLAALEVAFNANTANFQIGYQLFAGYLAAKNTNKAVEIMDKLVANPQADTRTLLAAFQGYTQLQLPAKRQTIVPRLIKAAQGDLGRTNADVNTLQMAAQAFNFTGQMAPLEGAMSRLSQLLPDSAETWYDLAGVRAVLGQKASAVAALSNAVRLSDSRLKQNAKALNLRARVASDARFKALKDESGFSDLTL